MNDTSSIFSWVESQRDGMLERIIEWSEVNSHSHNLKGLETMLGLLKRDFSRLEGRIETVALPDIKTIDRFGRPSVLQLGNCLALTKRPEAPIQLFFGGHMDTVYPQDSPFQKTRLIDSNLLSGPGVADMKGGLAVMLTALQAFEQTSIAGQIGYRILINSDEEIGSMGSMPLFKKYAAGCRAALLFEPAFPDGTLAGARKGSANYTLLVEGQSAHAGRDFFSGKSAVATLSELLVDIHLLNHPERETTLNLGYIYGGGPVNIVPDLALCRLNVRAMTTEEMEATEKQLSDMADTLAKKHGVQCRLICESRRPPKPFDDKTAALFNQLKQSAEEMGQNFQWHPTGGACDGNFCSALGVPTADSCGVVGGKIHTPGEFLRVDSLVEKAQWIASVLFKMAKGDL